MLNLITLLIATSLAGLPDDSARVCADGLVPKPPRIEVSLDVTSYEELDVLMRDLPPAPRPLGAVTRYFTRGFTPDVRSDTLRLLNEFKSSGFFSDAAGREARGSAAVHLSSSQMITRELHAGGVFRRIVSPRSRRGRFESTGLKYRLELRWTVETNPNAPSQPRLTVRMLMSGDFDLLAPLDRARLELARDQPRAYFLGAMRSADTLTSTL